MTSSSSISFNDKNNNNFLMMVIRHQKGRGRKSCFLQLNQHHHVILSTMLLIQVLFIFIIASVSAFSSPIETTQTIYGVVGGKASLPCNITAPTPDDAVSLILWYKEDSTTPIYSLDARKGNLDQARHASSDSLATRSYFSTLTKNAHLLIENLLEDDAGEYKCRADFRRARTRNFAVYLKVITPPEKPIIKDTVTDEVYSSLIGPYNEGDRLSLSCETRGGKPRPSLSWWRESALLDDSYEITAAGIMRNTLEINALQRHDLMAVLTCQAINNNISNPVASSVTVDLNFRPLTVQIEHKVASFSAEKSVEVVCKSSGSRPPATISWFKGNKPLKRVKDKVSIDGNTTTSTLMLTPTADDQGKQLTCRAENTLIPNSGIEDGFKLEINYIPQLSLRLGSKLRHSHIQEGNDVYFDCNVRANPWVTEIRWWFEGKEVHTNTSAGVIVSNQSLVLQRVSRLNRGRYTCSATNSEGEGESNSVHLRVQYAPVCKTSQKILYGAARQEAVKIHCEVDSDPAEVTFRWAFNNTSENIVVENHAPSADGGSSIATYVPRSELDYGTLFCWGRNNVGQQIEPCVFSVIPAGPPDAVKNCSVTNQTEDALKIDCQEGYDGGLSQHFIMEVRDSTIQRLRSNVTNAWPSFTAKGLSPGGTYVAVVYAANAKGRSKGVVLTASTTSLPESMNRLAKGNVWQLSLSPMLLILVGIVAVLVIFAFIIVIIIRVRSGSNRVNRKTRDVKRDGNRSLQDKSSEIPLRKASTEDVYDTSDGNGCTCHGMSSTSTGVTINGGPNDDENDACLSHPDDNCPDVLLPGQHHTHCHLHESSHDGSSLNDGVGSMNMTTSLINHQGNGGIYGQLSGLNGGNLSNSFRSHYSDNDLKETSDTSSARLLTGVNGTRVILVCTPSSNHPAAVVSTAVPTSTSSTASPYNHPCLVYEVLPPPSASSTGSGSTVTNTMSSSHSPILSSRPTSEEESMAVCLGNNGMLQSSNNSHHLHGHVVNSSNDLLYMPHSTYNSLSSHHPNHHHHHQSNNTSLAVSSPVSTLQRNHSLLSNSSSTSSHHHQQQSHLLMHQHQQQQHHLISSPLTSSSSQQLHHPLQQQTHVNNVEASSSSWLQKPI